jgi:hypothetical protein
MAVGVEQAHALAVDPGHPLPGQAALPLGCLTVLTAELGDLLPQGFDLRQPIQAQQFAPLPRRKVTALLQRTAAHQGQKSRQRTKHPGVRHIISGDKLQLRTGQKPAGGHHPLQRPSRAVTHLRLAISQRTLTERAGCTGTPFIAQQPCYGLRTIDRDPNSEGLSSRASVF